MYAASNIIYIMEPYANTTFKKTGFCMEKIQYPSIDTENEHENERGAIRIWI